MMAVFLADLTDQQTLRIEPQLDVSATTDSASAACEALIDDWHIFIANALKPGVISLAIVSIQDFQRRSTRVRGGLTPVVGRGFEVRNCFVRAAVLPDCQAVLRACRGKRQMLAAIDRPAAQRLETSLMPPLLAVELIDVRKDGPRDGNFSVGV